MKQVTYTISENKPLTADVFRMTLSGDTSAITAPGQFVNLKLDGLFLRRPISVCDWDESAGLGNGFDVAACPNNPVLVGGGVGVPPLYGLAKRLLAAGKKPSVILGFNTAEEIFYDMTFAALGVNVTVTTADGTAGVKGFVTQAMQGGEYVCACGPEPMLKAVHALASGGQFSFEARMGCGFGACMGCSCQTIAGPKRICKEGPVMRYEEILWQKDKSIRNEECNCSVPP